MIARSQRAARAPNTLLTDERTAARLIVDTEPAGFPYQLQMTPRHVVGGQHDVAVAVTPHAHARSHRKSPLELLAIRDEHVNHHFRCAGYLLGDHVGFR